MNRRWIVCAGLAAVLACCALADRVAATTIIPVSDEDLVATSELIVEGRCQRIRAVWNEDRTAIYTLVTFRVTKVIKGDIQPGNIELSQFGGQLSDGATVVWGAPYWQKSWRMLLFLSVEPAGGYRVSHLSLGYFRVVTDAATGTASVVRPMPGPNVRVVGDRPIERSEPKDAFVAKIQSLVAMERSAGPHHTSRPGKFVEAPGSTGQTPTNFRFLSPGFRWFEPDSGERIRFRVNTDRSPSPSGGVDEANATAAAWSSVPGSSLRVEISGSTTGCGLRADGTNSISFNDCTGRFDRPVNCTGIVAIGGVAQAVTNQSVSIGGTTFSRIQDADVIFNPGFECLLSNTQVLAEIMTHELGHALGFGHSSEQVNESSELLRDATLFFIAHLDGRGASLRVDDMDGARFLYRAAPSTQPLGIVTDALPDAPTGAPYTFDLVATGSGPFTWSIIDGTLPPGLMLSSGGRLSGTSIRDADTLLTILVRDGANFELTRTLALRSTGNPAPFIALAKFKSASGKLLITAFNVDTTATISVNGLTIAPPKSVKFKAAKNQLVVAGSFADLNIRTGAPNTVSIEVRGQGSNSVTF